MNLRLWYQDAVEERRGDGDARRGETGVSVVSGGGGGARALLRLGVLALLWGSTFLWIKIALEGLPPAWVTFLRCAFGAALLLVLALRAGLRLPRGRALWGRLTVAALLCNAAPFLLFSVGEQSVDSGVAGVLNATTPLWSLLIGLALGTERGIRGPRLGGLLAGFAGVLLIFAPWHRSGLVSWGALALVGAAASYALAFAYMGRRLAAAGTGTLPLAAAQLTAATALSVPALFVTGTGGIAVTLRSSVAVLVLGVLCTGVTFHLTVRIIADEGPTDAATVGYLLPVVSVGLGALVLDEPVGGRVVAGMLVVLAGVGLTRVRGLRLPRRRHVDGPGERADERGGVFGQPHGGPVGGGTEETRQIPLGAGDPAAQHIDGDLERRAVVPPGVDGQPDDVSVPFGER
ncbi:DMT family transporter [Actinacidiphila glaucinigra]|uniref:DMT family transporter n=1 Tax=Actinacidiphila glaucinigra TaxID=235986 RepID=UPI0037C915FD